MIKLDTNLCNESWFEMEIANLQTQMAAYPYESDEYGMLMHRMIYLTDQVLRIEDARSLRLKSVNEVVAKGIEFGGIVIFGGLILKILGRIIK